MDPIRSLFSRWLPTLSVAVFGLTLAGCNCELTGPEEDDSQGGCLIGTQCPNGQCVLPLFGWSEDICCGFGGECLACADPWEGEVECPDGTCAWSSEQCCAHGGACAPGESADTGDATRDSGSDESGATDTGADESTDSGSDTMMDTEADTDTDGSTTGEEPTGTGTGGSSDGGSESSGTD